MIMGRKTWDSIPEKFRPLKGRVNVVLSSSFANDEGSAVAANDSEAARFPSLSTALEGLKKAQALDKLFIIGGAVLYKTALQEHQTKRILLTRIMSDFECDTFFPMELGDGASHDGWEKKSKEELDKWVGETVPEGVQEENGVRYVFEMYERNI